MGIEQDIFNAVKDALKDNSTLKNYVQEVYDGFQGFDDTFVGDNIRNYIILEPLSAEEENPIGSDNLYSSAGVPKQLQLSIGIIGVITAIKNKGFSYVTGWDKEKGILDLDEDIKNALDNSDTVQALANTAINVTTQNFIFETFPKRKVVILLTITRDFIKGGR